MSNVVIFFIIVQALTLSLILQDFMQSEQKTFEDFHFPHSYFVK